MLKVISNCKGKGRGVSSILDHNLRFIEFKTIERFYSQTFREDDVVILQKLTDPSKIIITQPLKQKSICTREFGKFYSDNLIGLKEGAIIKSAYKDLFCVARFPTLEEYIKLRTRIAQPIYAYDAAAIANLLHLDPNFPQLKEDGVGLKEEPLQILEAGTGHGSLTLAICRTIHAANCYKKVQEDGTIINRGAILHSIDRNKDHLVTGKNNVKYYKRGMYFDDVNFELSHSPTKWLKDNASKWSNNKEFLSAAFLDLQEPGAHIEQIAEHLVTDAQLIIFCPSVTQIVEVYNTLLASKGTIHLSFEQTIQIAPGMGGGLTRWEIKNTIPKGGSNAREAWICRPKVGSSVVGGGFIGILKKIKSSATLKDKSYKVDNVLFNTEVTTLNNSLNFVGLYDKLKRLFGN